MGKIKILFVCMGNICRSPSAEGIFRHLVEEHKVGPLFEIDSAGTHAYHIGEPPDRRSQEAAARRSIDISSLQARQVMPKDFEYYHYLLAMDRENYKTLRKMSSPQHLHKIHLFMKFAPHFHTEEVPDPYYGGADGFEQVLDMVDAAARGLLAELQSTVFARLKN